MIGGGGLPARISSRYYLASILAALLIGAGFYLLLLKPLDHFIGTVIHASMREAVADVQRLCEYNYGALLRAGVVGDSPATRIQQAVTLGLLEDYAASRQLRIQVWDGDELLLGRREPAPAEVLPAAGRLLATALLVAPDSRQAVSKIDFAGRSHYAAATTFSPWEWRLVVLKESGLYQSARQRLHQAYYATIALLLAWVLLGIIFFKRQIEKPIARIISSLRQGEKPAYRGAYEFEFLSDHLAAAMAEQEQLHQRFFQQQKLESIGLLAGGIAHDFNNLLAALYGQISMANLDLPPGHPARHPLELAEQSADRARSLTAQLLTYSTGGTLNRRIQDIAGLLTEIGHFVISGEGYQLRLHIADDLWESAIDRQQIGNVLHNLLLNAKEAMPSGGTVEIVAANRELPTSSGLPLAPGCYLRLQIRDYGPGIPAANLSLIFEPYFSSKPRGATKGTGLGLSICQSVITRHGGHIEVASQPGRGTTFTIYLPAAAPG
ncbi:MAG: ATP-binding protein [Desulfurivibrio sp.]|nr:ATP-binding protein [Desulfurivibrio sp.]